MVKPLVGKALRGNRVKNIPLYAVLNTFKGVKKMNSVSVVMDKSMTIGEIMENIVPCQYGLKAELVEDNFVFSGEMTDELFGRMLTGIKMCTMCTCYDVYKNGEKVW